MCVVVCDVLGTTQHTPAIVFRLSMILSMRFVCLCVSASRIDFNENTPSGGFPLVIRGSLKVLDFNHHRLVRLNLVG